MKIIVCAKAVPNQEEIRLGPDGNLARNSALTLNSGDEYALEEALKVKDMDPETEILVLSMGPPEAVSVLRDCLARGADSAILLSDPVFKGSDTLATSRILAAAIKRETRKKTGYLVFSSVSSDDGETGHVPPQIAAILGIKAFLFCDGIDSVSGDSVKAGRKFFGFYEKAEFSSPAVISFGRGINEPRLPSFKGRISARKAEIPVIKSEDLALPSALMGTAGSPTRVVSWEKAESAGKLRETKIMREESPEEKAGKIIEILKESKFL